MREHPGEVCTGNCGWWEWTTKRREYIIGRSDRIERSELVNCEGVGPSVKPADTRRVIARPIGALLFQWVVAA